jgi:hypothetical protein
MNKLYGMANTKMCLKMRLAEYSKVDSTAGLEDKLHE